MKRIHFCGIVLLFFVFCSHHLQAKPSITVIKGMTELFEGHEDASPLLGCLAWESQWIENIYRFWKDSGKKQASSSIQQLVTELFYLQPDTVTFGPTVKGLNIAAHFNAKTIGVLLATIEVWWQKQKEKTIDDSKEQLINDLASAILKNLHDNKKIKEKLEYDKNKVDERLKEASKEMEPFRQEVEKVKKEIDEVNAELIEIIENLDRRRDKTKDFTDQEIKNIKNKDITQEQVQRYNQHLANKNKLVALNKKIKELDEKSKLSYYKKQLKILLGSLDDIDSFKDKESKKLSTLIANILLQKKQVPCDLFFDNIALNRVLLAWLWASSIDKQGFVDYYKAFMKKLDLDDGQKALKKFTESDYDKSDYFALLKIYTEDDDDDSYKSFLKKPARFEELLFLYFGFDLFESPYPPHVKGYFVTVIANNQIYNFPDCGETSLRNFFNMLLWNTNNRKFDTNILKNCFSQCDKELINFYTQNSDTLTLELPTLYNAWATLCSKIPEVIYGNTNICNIRGTGVTNISRVIAHLLGIDISNSDANKIAPFVFKTITKNLEKNDITFQCSPDFKDTLDNEVDVVYSFDISSEEVEKKLTWQFMLGHYVAFFDSEATTRPNIPLYTYCEKNIAFAGHLVPMTILNTTKKSAITGINEVFSLNKLKSDVSFVLYSNNDYVKTTLVKVLLEHKDFDAHAYSQLDNSNFLGSIQDRNVRKDNIIKIIEKYPNLLPKCLNVALKNEYDEVNIKAYVLKIIKNKIQPLYGMINYWLKNLQNERYKRDIMVAIITTDSTLTDYVKENLSSIKNKDNIVGIIVAIINSKITDLILIDYVIDNLPSITGEYYKASPIVAIINSKTTDLTLIDYVKNNLSSINDESLKKDVMVAIIKSKNTDLTLISYVKNNISSIKNECYKNEITIAVKSLDESELKNELLELMKQLGWK